MLQCREKWHDSVQYLMSCRSSGESSVQVDDEDLWSEVLVVSSPPRSLA